MRKSILKPSKVLHFPRLTWMLQPQISPNLKVKVGWIPIISLFMTASLASGRRRLWREQKCGTAPNAKITCLLWRRWKSIKHLSSSLCISKGSQRQTTLCLDPGNLIYKLIFPSQDWTWRRTWSKWTQLNPISTMMSQVKNLMSRIRWSLQKTRDTSTIFTEWVTTSDLWMEAITQLSARIQSFRNGTIMMILTLALFAQEKMNKKLSNWFAPKQLMWFFIGLENDQKQ